MAQRNGDTPLGKWVSLIGEGSRGFDQANTATLPI